jgi:NDP-sugar pyrophosphorylase family protein
VLPPIVVLVGGLGTRVAGITGPDRPKALLDVAGEPFLVRRLRELAAEGVPEAWLLVGHGAAVIGDVVGDGAGLGLAVRYVHDGPRLLGTGGAVRAALLHLPERFLLTYGDTFLPAALAPIVEAWDGSGRPALMTVLRNDDRWEPSNVAVADGLVVRYEKGASGLTHIDYGMLAFERAVFDPYPVDDPFDLGIVLRDLIDRRELAAHEVHERFHDIGNPAAYEETARWAAGRPDPR